MPKEPNIGAEFYSLNIDEDTGTHDWSIYRVRSIQNRKGFYGVTTTRYVYAILVERYTWGKRSTKSGDYGWLPNIHQWCRKKWRAGEQPPWGIFTTKKAAIQHELKSYREASLEDLDNPVLLPKIITKLENMLKRS